MVFGYELTDKDKKWIKENIPCELHHEEEECEGNKQIHRIHRQEPYTLRNIIVLCSLAHKMIHGKEQGMINR